MKFKIEELGRCINEVIELCRLALNGNLEEIAFGSNEAQIKNIILPEMNTLLDAIRSGEIDKYLGKRLNSSWYVSDSWDLNSVLGKKISIINNMLN